MKKQLLGIVAALFVFVALLPIGAYAADNVYALLYDDGTLVFQHSAVSSDSGRTVTNTYEVDLNAVYDWDFYAPWYDERESIKVVTFADKVSPTSTAWWFYSCQNLERIDNISNLDTVNITDMSYMFFYCWRLRELDLSRFNTANVTNMSYMFSYCRYLQALDLSHFDTSKVTSMSGMFYSSWYLKALDISHFDTANVTDMSYMFCECWNLTALDISSFDTSKVTNMSRMFCDCGEMMSLDVSDFDTANVTDMAWMFYDCKALTTLDLSGFDTSNVTDMHSMFYNCFGLTALDVSGFDTSNVIDTGSMFFGCGGLTTLDLSGFNNTSNFTVMKDMFRSCSKLVTIYVSDKFLRFHIDQGEGMFFACTALVGGAGTKYDQYRTDATYAQIDGGTSDPGYFTDKNAPAPVTYTVTWKNYDGAVLKTDTGLTAGTVPAYGGVTPIRTGYAFAGWSPEPSALSGDATYTAQFTELAPVTYTVTWKNYDGAVLKTDTGLAAGTVPAYVGDTPIRTGYAFAGWSPEPSALSGDATYTAQFTEIAPILFDVTRDAYAFGNSMADFGYTSAGGPGGGKHPITPNSFFVIFGETVKAKMLYKQKTAFPWGGNCAGMSGSAALFYANTGLNPSDFGQSNVWGVGIGDKNAEMSALTFVEAMQVAQYADAFVKARQENNRTAAELRNGKTLNALFEAVRTDMEAGRPTLLAIVKSGVGGHALLAIGAEEVSATESRIRIYDCNHPGETRYLTLGKDASGNLKTWRYDMGGHGVWGTGDENGDLCSVSYVPYAVLEEIWTNRGKQQQKSQVLTVNADNVSITDINGKPVASLENGQFSANAEGVYEIVELSMYWPKERSVCLPRNETYTLTTSDNITLTASMTDSHMSAEISTSANEVTFGVSDDERENSVMVTGASASDTYEIALESDFEDFKDKSISLGGNGGEENISVSITEDGASVPQNVKLTSLSLNGKSLMYDILLVTPDKEKGKLSVVFTNAYPVTVAAAYFDGNGKFMSARLQSVQANAKTAEFPLPPDAKTARVILCDTDCRPLCEPYEANIG